MRDSNKRGRYFMKVEISKEKNSGRVNWIVAQALEVMCSFENLPICYKVC
jgi:hypothetical protein